MPKKRKAIPKKIEACVLAANRHRCCICHKRVGAIQIHHIDGDRNNNDPENLCVLCLDHHDEVEGKHGLGKSYTIDELRIYKKEWEETNKIQAKTPTNETLTNMEIEILTSLSWTEHRFPVNIIMADLKLDYQKTQSLLDQLEEKGLVTSQWDLGGGTIYGLTGKGKAFLRKKGYPA